MRKKGSLRQEYKKSGSKCQGDIPIESRKESDNKKQKKRHLGLLFASSENASSCLFLF